MLNIIILVTADGALFKGDTLTPSFITLPFTKLNLSNPFNISFSYETFLEDGSKPQTFLLLLVDISKQAYPTLHLFCW